MIKHPVVTCKKCGEEFVIYVMNGKPIAKFRCPKCAEPHN